MSETLAGNYRRLTLVFAIAVVAFVISTAPGYCQSFRVKKIAVCSNNLKNIESQCAEVKGPFDSLDRRKFANNRIDMKVWIECEKEAVSFIDSNNNVLPVNVAIWKNGIRTNSDINIGITQDHWEQDGEALKALLSEQGSFPWRTRFYLRLDGVQTVSIEINDARDNVTLIGNDPARLKFSFSN